MDILVFGGAGFFGSQLSDQLVDEGHNVSVADIAGPTHSSKKIKYLKLDIRSPESYAQLKNHYDVVINCAAALPSYHEKEIYSVDVEGMRVIIFWLRKINITQFIHISSTAVYGPAHAPYVKETAQPNPCDPYSRAKLKGEEIISELLAESSIHWTILRPKAFVGKKRLGIFAVLYDFALSGKRFPVLGEGKATYQFLHTNDLIKAIILTMSNAQRANRHILNVSSLPDGTVSELFQQVLNAAGHGAKILSVPAAPAKYLLKFSSIIGISPIYDRIIHNLLAGSTISLEKTKQVIGYEPTYTSSQALLEGFDWYVANHHNLKEGKTHSSLWKNKLASAVKWMM